MPLAPFTDFETDGFRVQGWLHHRQAHLLQNHMREVRCPPWNQIQII